MSRKRWHWLPLMAVLALVLAVGMAACGGDDEGEEGADGAAAPGQAAAPEIDVEPRRIGIVNLIRQSPAEDKIDRFYESAADALGWEVDIIDGGADPKKIARATQNFINQGVDAIITTSTEAAIMKPQLRRAKDQNIPWISTNGGTTESDLFTAQYEEDESRMGRQLAEHIKQTVEDPKIANLKTSIAISGVLRDEAFHDVFSEDQFVAEQEIDLTNPVVNTEKTLNDMLTANPDVNVVHAVFDNMSQAAVTTIERRRSDAKLYNYFTTETNVENLRSETPLQAVSDVNLPHTGGVAFDELLAFFEKDDPIEPDALEQNPLTYQVVSRDNIDDLLGEKDESFPNAEILRPFVEKWAEEYPG